jgi:isocitrate dehydrogenase (NAD+)
MVDGLFLECARESARKYPTIAFEEMIVDNTCMQLVKSPQQFDLMVMPNLYGSITQAICAGLVGGAGVTAAAAFGKEYMMFEPG